MKKPNILLIMTDQLRAFSLGCYGDRFAKTPNIDRLACEGVRFEQTVSNCPLCGPKRNTALQIGAFTGRMIRSGHAKLFGWSINFHQILSAKKFMLFLHANTKSLFFLYYNIEPPHMPFGDMPEKYRQLYHPADVPLRPNVQLDGPNYRWWYHTYLWDYRYYDLQEAHTLNLPGGFGIHELTALYYGMISWVDDLVGNVMASLRANGLEDNTIVLFTSDHGENLGSHGYFNKERLIEESIRIPLMVRWSNHIAPQVNQQHQAQLIDIMPTLLDLAGCEVPASVQGRALTPLLRGGVPTMDGNFAFIETPPGQNQIGVRTATHKYGMQLRDDYSMADEKLCFYDLTADPYEKNNLIKCGGQEEIAGELHDVLLAWHRKTPRFLPA